MASFNHQTKSNDKEASSDEEPDYMSDDFLKQCTQNDIRPSLIHNRGVKRKHDILSRQQELNKTRLEREKDRLKSVEDAMKVPISEDNKGFKMLQKMGYKPGSSIGNNPTRGGIKEPIEIELKTGRKGLGRERHEESKFKKELEQSDPEEFRSRKQSAIKRREIAGDLRKAQFSCQSLDQSAGLSSPSQKWYWQKTKSKKTFEGGMEPCMNEEDFDDFKQLGIPLPPHIKKPRCEGDIESSDDDNDNGPSESDSDDDDDDDDDVTEEQKLDSIVDYLRTTYFYCLWCGMKYDNQSDISASCPGTSKDDH